MGCVEGGEGVGCTSLERFLVQLFGKSKCIGNLMAALFTEQ